MSDIYEFEEYSCEFEICSSGGGVEVILVDGIIRGYRGGVDDMMF